jgi:acylphosphatase
MPTGKMPTEGAKAVRVIVRGGVQEVGFREAAVRAARRLGVLGWVRNADDGSVRVHAEGPAAAEQPRSVLSDRTLDELFEGG